MADMYGAVRSNWFKVKDRAAFKKWFNENCYFGGEIELWLESDNVVGFGGYEMYPSAWPRFPAEEDENGYYEDGKGPGEREWDLKDFAEALRQHFADDQQELVVVAAGNENLRYVAAQRLRVGAYYEDFNDWYAGN